MYIYTKNFVISVSVCRGSVGSLSGEVGASVKRTTGVGEVLELSVPVPVPGPVPVPSLQKEWIQMHPMSHMLQTHK